MRSHVPPIDPATALAAEAAGEPSFAERRSEPRVAANAPARVFYGVGFALWLDCLIKDRSSKGAKIQCPAMYELSSRLILLDYQQGFAFEAEVRWRKGDMAGLRLKEVHDLYELTDPALQGIREAWQALAPGIARPA